MDEAENQNEKCRLCYLVKGCMLTIMMSKMCGGPWKNEDERDDFIREQILGIKNEIKKKP
jgi:hypothetical protein